MTIAGENKIKKSNPAGKKEKQSGRGFVSSVAHQTSLNAR
jgi:hypothetical protein